MNNKTFRLGFIGAGNMGGALARAASRGIQPSDIIITDVMKEKACELAGSIGAVTGSSGEVAALSEYIFLGVKPQMMKDMLCEITPVLRKRETPFILVTMAAGISVSDIKSMMGEDYPTIRIMPNMPVSVGHGMILYTADDAVSDEKAAEFTEIMKYAGAFDRIPEKLIDAGSALSGCGPAYAFIFVEALADGAVACGLPRDKAVKYAAETLAGSAELLLSGKKHPGELKDAVCSPGGSTIEGVAALENGAFRASVMNAVIKAYDKTIKLGK